MTETTTRQRYAPISIVLHWAMLLLITGCDFYSKCENLAVCYHFAVGWASPTHGSEI